MSEHLLSFANISSTWWTVRGASRAPKFLFENFIFPYNTRHFRSFYLALFPSAPRTLTVISTTPTSVIFSWEAPLEKGDGVVNQYHYEIRTQHLLVRNGSVASTNNIALVKKLKPYTKYELSLAARNKHGLGDRSSLSFTTQQAGTVVTN